MQPSFAPVDAPIKIEELKQLVREVMVSEPVERYIISIITACTPGSPGATPEITQYLRFGPSPRGAQALILGGKVNALLAGSVSVSYEDIDDNVTLGACAIACCEISRPRRKTFPPSNSSSR